MTARHCRTRVSAREVFARRDSILKSVLQPSGIDVLNPAAASRLGLEAQWSLLMEALGSDTVLARYQKELPEYSVIDNEIWLRVREFTPAWLAEYTEAHVLRLSCQLMEMESRMTALPAASAAIGRGGNGIIYAHSPASADLPDGAKGLIDFSPSSRPVKERLWPNPGNDLSTGRCARDVTVVLRSGTAGRAECFR